MQNRLGSSVRRVVVAMCVASLPVLPLLLVACGAVLPPMPPPPPEPATSSHARAKPKVLPGANLALTASATTASADPANGASLSPLPEQQGRPDPDPRLAHHRQTALLVTEIQGLETLLSVTPPEASDRPQLLARVFADYLELEASALAGMAFDPTTKSRKTYLASEARERAIAYGSVLESDCPSYSQLDGVEAWVGYEYEKAGDSENALIQYEKILIGHGGSRYVPYAKLGRADMMYLDSDRSGLGWERVEEEYRSVLSIDAAKNSAAGYAWYKLSWVLEHEGRKDDSIDALGKAIAFADDHLDDDSAKKIGMAARADLANFGKAGPTATR